MSIIVDRFKKIKSNINRDNVNIIAVSKTFSFDHIKPLVDYGHLHFGENKVQEAESKWKSIRAINKDLKIHLIGKLQTNKAKKAIEIFDYIHSLDNQKLADTLCKLENAKSKKINYFIQVNVGMESQKSGIHPNQLDDFYSYCSKELNLNILGLMAIPPDDGNQDKYFKYLYETNLSLGLKQLSLGMSADYNIALKYNSTFLRIGSSIFGKRV
ncbi:YggS family pyridoxal phosphate-dependent enzyme [Pelagibacteraceae bacterium]|nr:YggS family pyridoxal phosphate-dependent enzyme [Pelagibacteraceae bacterium]